MHDRHAAIACSFCTLWDADVSETLGYLYALAGMGEDERARTYRQRQAASLALWLRKHGEDRRHEDMANQIRRLLSGYEAKGISLDLDENLSSRTDDEMLRSLSERTTEVVGRLAVLTPALDTTPLFALAEACELAVLALPDRPDSHRLRAAKRQADLVVEAFQVAIKLKRAATLPDDGRAAALPPPTPKRRRGKPASMLWSEATKLCADWDAARRNDSTKAEFCDERDIDLTRLESALRRVRRKKHADNIGRQAR